MCYWIMIESGTPISKTTVQHIARDDMLDADISEQTIKFNDALDTRLDESKFLIPRMGDFNLEDDGFQTPK